MSTTIRFSLLTALALLATLGGTSVTSAAALAVMDGGILFSEGYSRGLEKYVRLKGSSLPSGYTSNDIIGKCFLSDMAMEAETIGTKSSQTEII